MREWKMEWIRRSMTFLKITMTFPTFSKYQRPNLKYRVITESIDEKGGNLMKKICFTKDMEFTYED